MLIAPELDNHLVSLDLSLKQMRNPSLVVGTVNQGSGGVDSEADDHSRSSSGAAPDRMVTNEVETVSCSPRGGGRGAGAEELAGGDGGQSLNDHFDGQGGGEYDVTRAEDVPADGGEPIPRQQQTSLPKGILSETRRGSGSGASPWKQVKFHEELPEGFPERTGQRHRRLHQRGGDLSSFTSLLLVLASVWVIRIFQILTKKLLSSVSDDPEEF